MLRQNQTKLWGVICDQCPPALQVELKGDQEFAVAMAQYDNVWLLTKLKMTTTGIDRSVSPYQALVNSLTLFHTLRQKEK